MSIIIKIYHNKELCSILCINNDKLGYINLLEDEINDILYILSKEKSLKEKTLFQGAIIEEKIHITDKRFIPILYNQLTEYEFKISNSDLTIKEVLNNYKGEIKNEKIK